MNIKLLSTRLSIVSFLLALPISILGAQTMHSAKEVWHNIGPGGGGWIESLAVDPKDRDVVYAGSDVGGIFKSIDGGGHWKAMNVGLQNDFIRDILIDPDHRDVLYVATPGGVHKSVNGGRSWALMRQGFPPISSGDFSAPVNTLAMDPVNSSILYAGIGLRQLEGQGRIYKTMDAGGHWEVINEKGAFPANAVIQAIAIHATETDILYAATNAGVYQSLDAGRTWQSKNNGLKNLNAQSITFNPQQATTLYLTVGASLNKNVVSGGALYKSTDAGARWRLVKLGQAHLTGEANERQGFEPGQITPDYHVIASDPINHEVYYLGDVSWESGGIYQTRDGGAGWKKITAQERIKNYGWASHWGIEVNDLVIAPSDSQTMYVGSSAHIFKSNNGGSTWNQVYSLARDLPHTSSNGLETSCIFSLTHDAREPSRIYVGYFDLGLMVSDDQGVTFQRRVNGMRYVNNIFTTVVDPDNASTVYAAAGEWAVNEGEIYKSFDQGKNWQVLGAVTNGLPLGRVRFLLIDAKSPLDQRILYAGIDEKGIYKSNNGGQQWFAANQGLKSTDMRGLIFDPLNSQILFAAVGGDTVGGIYKSVDGAATWKKIVADHDFPNIQMLYGDPHNAKVFYMGHREYELSGSSKIIPGGLFKSMDQGRTWEKILANKFISTVVVSPDNAQHIYVGTTDHNYHDGSRGQGVYQSLDGGHHWTLMNEGLGSLRITHLNFNPAHPEILYAATAGNGLFIRHVKLTQERQGHL